MTIQNLESQNKLLKMINYLYEKLNNSSVSSVVYISKAIKKRIIEKWLR